MRWFRCLSLLILLVFIGCGRTGPKAVSVSGRVTMDQKPLANADVSFLPVDSDPNNSASRESAGRTDEQGRFTLKLIQDQSNGAVVGTHKVRISVIERGTKIVNRVPKEYNENTKLTFTVPAEGTTEANFDLNSQGK
jgi:hypothetical protein